MPKGVRVQVSSRAPIRQAKIFYKVVQGLDDNCRISAVYKRIAEGTYFAVWILTMKKYLLFSFVICLQVFAFAATKLPADKAIGIYNCSGTKNGVAHYGTLDIYTDDEGKTILEYSENEALITYNYSKASFSDLGDGSYRLNLGGIRFTCTPFGN